MQPGCSFSPAVMSAQECNQVAVQPGCSLWSAPMSELHPATRGFAAADVYERGRPDYPAAAIAKIVERLGLRPGRTVLDLAAGTGKLTRLLAPSGANVIAVEPVHEMRAELERRVPGIAALAGTAERIPLTDGYVDAVTVGQAFHWFDADKALREIHRVLTPRRRARADLERTRRARSTAGRALRDHRPAPRRRAAADAGQLEDPPGRERPVRAQRARSLRARAAARRAAARGAGRVDQLHRSRAGRGASRRRGTRTGPRAHGAGAASTLVHDRALPGLC